MWLFTEKKNLTWQYIYYLNLNASTVSLCNIVQGKTDYKMYALSKYKKKLQIWSNSLRKLLRVQINRCLLI